MKKCELVIELGSSNTTIYMSGSGIVLREPSLVAVKSNSSGLFEVGAKAKKMIGKTSNSIMVFSPIKSGTIIDEKYAELMLKEFLKKIVKNSVVSKVNAVFCISNGLSDAQLSAFKSVAYFAGISDVKFANCCLASLLGAGVNVSKPSATICVNIGGGTTDLAVISLNEIINGFSINFGGIDMDISIKDYILNTYSLDISLSTAEKLKNECGSLYVHDTTNLEVSGIDVATKRPMSMIVTSTDVRIAIQHFFENLSLGIEHLINLCSAEVVSDIASNGIFVTGGVANIVGLENFLKKKLSLPVTIPDEPENCEILGGALLKK